jgi:uncharacterized repeat protein (TIGR01451 family)
VGGDGQRSWAHTESKTISQEPTTFAPLTYVRFLLPEGIRVTVYPGTPQARLYAGDVRLGLRPGYSYRFELSNLPPGVLPPDEPTAVLYPEVTVHSSLVMRSGIDPREYPVPVTLSSEDLSRALSGGVVVKFVYLEDPCRAIPAATSPDAPVEIRDEDEQSARHQALQGGRLFLTIRLGNRVPSPQELRSAAIDHTILLPGMQRLPAPARPPQFPLVYLPLVDPLLGPQLPSQECLSNGGDRGAALGIGAGQRLGGLEPGEVAVEYTLRQRRQVTTSPSVALCAPRFVIRRAEHAPHHLLTVARAAQAQERNSPSAVQQREQPLAHFHYQRLAAVHNSSRPSLFFNRMGTSLFAGSLQLQAVAQVAGLKIVGVLVAPEQLTAYPTVAPLTVSKQIDPIGSHRPGDVVTVIIRFVNSGDQPLANLVVSDHLSPRLEYVPESSQTNRAANFNLMEQLDGTQLLRWDFPGELLPGQAGMIRFKVRIR